jgi:solute carrier family 25 protein 39/40
MTTTLVSPIELIRTKVQSLPANTRMIDMVQSELRSGGIGSLWRGVSPTLWRDVPFSAIYWSAYEYNKKQLTPWANGEHGSPAIASFISGATSGTLAALITHPFDLV